MTKSQIIFLSIRGNGKIAPPSLYSVNTHSSTAAHRALLNTAIASVSRALSCLCLCALPLSFVACERDMPLPDGDTVTRAVADTTATDSTAAGTLSMTITVDTTWAGYIYEKY